jgi:phosphoglycolate phosphatase-like HAD superfamily hydrolase
VHQEVELTMGDRAVIFDVDGTLIDSNDAHARAWVDALKEFGFARDVAQVRRLIGMGGDKLLPAAAGVSADSDLGRRILDYRGRRFREAYLDSLQAFPGTRALFERLREDGVLIAIASSAQKEELSRLLRIAGVDDLVHRRTSGDDVAASKPDPDVLDAALTELDMGPEAAIMVGDTPYDVEASGRAHVAAIAFRCGGWNDGDLAGTIAIYDGPAAMLDSYTSGGSARRAIHGLG